MIGCLKCFFMIVKETSPHISDEADEHSDANNTE
jgi:hypothetical protein